MERKRCYSMLAQKRETLRENVTAIDKDTGRLERLETILAGQNPQIMADGRGRDQESGGQDETPRQMLGRGAPRHQQKILSGRELSSQSGSSPIENELAFVSATLELDRHILDGSIELRDRTGSLANHLRGRKVAT